VILVICGGLLTTVLDNAKQTFDLILSIGAGTGLVYLLRWFWWRINAWTEVSAMAASFAMSAVFFLLGKTGHPVQSSIVLLSTVAFTTLVWLLVTFLTPQVDEATLEAFYRKVRPAGAGWSRIRRRSGAAGSPDSLPLGLLGWILGLLAIYSVLFGTGAYLYGRVWAGIAYTVVLAVSVVWLVRITALVWHKRDDFSTRLTGV